MISETFETQVRPMLEQLPEKYHRAIHKAFFDAAGYAHSAPDIEDCFIEIKDLLLYFADISKSQENEDNGN